VYIDWDVIVLGVAAGIGVLLMLLFSDPHPPTKVKTWTRQELEKRYELAEKSLEQLSKLVEKLLKERGQDDQQFLAVMEQVQWMQKQIYGQKSERSHQDPKTGGSDDSRRSDLRPKILLPSKRYPDLEVRKERIDFPEPPTCDHCEKPMKDMGQTEDSERIEVIPKYYYILRLQRAKYCCAHCYDRIKTAPLPPRILPGSSFGDSFILDLAVSKYSDHIPVERYARIARRMGLTDLHGSSLYELLHRLADRGAEEVANIKQAVLEERVPHGDETWIRMMERDPKKTWWIWAFLNEKNAYYEAHDSRAAEKARAFFEKSQAEYAVSDAYAGYPRAMRGLSIKNAFCWAHARRKFVDAEPNHPEARSALDEINELFRIERRIKNKDPTARIQVRKKESTPVLDRLKNYLMELHVPRVLSIGKARNYVLKHWTELTRFMEDGRVPIDNNAAERSLRGIVLGRKNFLGMHSPRGGKTTAALYTLMESCRRNALDPYKYLQEMTREILAGRSFPIPAKYAESFNAQGR